MLKISNMRLALYTRERQHLIKNCYLLENIIAGAALHAKDERQHSHFNYVLIETKSPAWSYHLTLMNLIRNEFLMHTPFVDGSNPFRSSCFFSLTEWIVISWRLCAHKIRQMANACYFSVKHIMMKSQQSHT